MSSETSMVAASVRPLVEAYFTWARENILKVPQKSKTWEGLNYSINQEKYLKVFLDDGEVPMDNNAAEQSIRGFCIGKNYVVSRIMFCSAAKSFEFTTRHCFYRT